MYSGRIKLHTVHRFSYTDISKLKLLGNVYITKSIGKKTGYIDIESKVEPNYLKMVHSIRNIEDRNMKMYNYSKDKGSIPIPVHLMRRITDAEIKRLYDLDIYVVKYDNEKTQKKKKLKEGEAWCTLYADSIEELKSGYDRIIKLTRGDILNGSKWCGKHDRFRD